MFKKLKDKKGFTLVELIVVLVILAILAALLVPALTGYIDKAKNQSIISETRQVVMAAQTWANRPAHICFFVFSGFCSPIKTPPF